MNRPSMSIIASGLLFLGAVESSVAAEKPMLPDDVELFTAFYGKAKEVDDPLGKTRLWRKGDFLIRHCEDRLSGNWLSIAKVATSAPMNRREAFALAKRFCGEIDWKLLSEDSDREVYVASDRRFQMTFTRKASDTSNGHVVLLAYRLAKGIEEL